MSPLAVLTVVIAVASVVKDVIKELEEEVEILKKALGLFARK